MKSEFEKLIHSFDEMDEQLRLFFVRQDELNKTVNQNKSLRDLLHILSQGYFRFFLMKTKRKIVKKWRKLGWENSL